MCKLDYCEVCQALIAGRCAEKRLVQLWPPEKISILHKISQIISSDVFVVISTYEMWLQFYCRVHINVIYM